MRSRRWVFSTLGWDGCLPLVVAVAPWYLPVLIPDRDLAELSAVILVPIVAALIRGHQGVRQLEGVGRSVGWVRQVLLGGAVVMLLLFEGLMGMLHFAADAPRSAWLAAGALYLVYLGLIVPALRPRRLEAE